jgi:hypothetical protein
VKEAGGTDEKSGGRRQKEKKSSSLSPGTPRNGGEGTGEGVQTGILNRAAA